MYAILNLFKRYKMKNHQVLLKNTSEEYISEMQESDNRIKKLALQLYVEIKRNIDKWKYKRNGINTNNIILNLLIEVLLKYN